MGSYKQQLVECIKIWLDEKEYKKRYPTEYRIYSLTNIELEEILIEILRDELGYLLPQEKLDKIISMVINYD